jgi:hypothetical protein
VAIVTKNKTNHERNQKNMKRVLSLMLAGVALLANQSHSVTFFADNFEEAGAAGATNIGAPWEMNKQVFGTPTVLNPSGYVGGHYPGTTFGPNAIVSGQGGVDQGTYQGKLWPDYDGWWGDWTDSKVVKTSLLFSIVNLSAADIAPGTIQMDFDYKLQGELGPNTSVFSFAKILSPNWSETWYTDWKQLTGGDWSHGSNVMNFDGNQVGANLQYGFMVVSENYQPNGVFVDNVTISNVPEPSTASLLGFGIAGLIATRLRRRS